MAGLVMYGVLSMSPAQAGEARVVAAGTKPTTTQGEPNSKPIFNEDDDLDEKIEKLETHIENNSEDPAALSDLGSCYLSKNNLKKGKQILDKALDLHFHMDMTHGSFAAYYAKMAFSQTGQEQARTTEKCINEYRIALALKPSNAEIRQNFERALRWAGQNVSGFDENRTKLTDPDWERIRGPSDKATWDYIERFTKAATLERDLRRNRKFTDEQKSWGYVKLSDLYTSKNLNEFGKATAEAVRLDQNNWAALHNRAVFFRKRKDYKRAEEYMNRALKSNANGDVHYGLGFIFYKQQLYAKALPHFEKAVQFNPDDTYAKRKIDRCKRNL